MPKTHTNRMPGIIAISTIITPNEAVDSALIDKFKNDIIINSKWNECAKRPKLTKEKVVEKPFYITVLALNNSTKLFNADREHFTLLQGAIFIAVKKLKIIANFSAFYKLIKIIAFRCLITIILTGISYFITIY